ncbi:MAG: transcription termination/antitermination protein NusA [Acidimicrobiales bacterium]|nr:transcription termination/antitermination protein NusA [Acidimicrobiales bacterium]
MSEMMEALQALAAEKGISVDTLMAALADALESAYKRMPDAHEYAWVTIDPTNFDIRVYAQEIDEDGEPYGPELDVTPADFGRIAAQTARQVMTQRIREAERELRYEEYAGREGDIVTGTVQQGDSRYTLLSLGPVEALLPQAEQVPHERPEANTRLKAYIVEVRRTSKGPQIVVSRTHPGLVLELFKLEVPEIADGVVEIKACAREPGHRTKIAVWSNDNNVDPVGACVGARGARVRQVVNELRGEKIDIVPFSDDPYEFVAKALSPAKVKEVRINEDTGVAEVIVPDYQLSLAIGKEGQNARLSARLTGWRVDIKSETQLVEEEAYGQQDWAEGEWVVDPESGEQVWQPAEGGPAMSVEDWEAAVTETSEAEAPAGESAAAEGEVPPAPPAVVATPDDASAEEAEVASEDVEATLEAEEAVAEEVAASTATDVAGEVAQAVETVGGGEGEAPPDEAPSDEAAAGEAAEGDEPDDDG